MEKESGVMPDVKIYADGAVIEEMLAAYRSGNVQGFTTNPSLMKKAGVTDYVGFAQQVVEAIPDLPVSFEVFGDDFDTMRKEAVTIAAFGSNVYVKIPITNTAGDSSAPLISELSAQGIQLNVTAITTVEQVHATVDAFTAGTANIVSVFAGRVADTGRDPMPLMTESAQICHSKAGAELLWASSREPYNIVQAADAGADIITCTPAILAKLSMFGMDLGELSLETVRGFARDIQSLGYSIL